MAAAPPRKRSTRRCLRPMIPAMAPLPPPDAAALARALPALLAWADARFPGRAEVLVAAALRGVRGPEVPPAWRLRLGVRWAALRRRGPASGRAVPWSGPAGWRVAAARAAAVRRLARSTGRPGSAPWALLVAGIGIGLVAGLAPGARGGPAPAGARAAAGEGAPGATELRVVEPSPSFCAMPGGVAAGRGPAGAAADGRASASEARGVAGAPAGLGAHGRRGPAASGPGAAAAVGEAPHPWLLPVGAGPGAEARGGGPRGVAPGAVSAAGGAGDAAAARAWAPAGAGHPGGGARPDAPPLRGVAGGSARGHDPWVGEAPPPGVHPLRVSSGSGPDVALECAVGADEPAAPVARAPAASPTRPVAPRARAVRRGAPPPTAAGAPPAPRVAAVPALSPPPVAAPAAPAAPRGQTLRFVLPPPAPARAARAAPGAPPAASACPLPPAPGPAQGP